MMAVSLQYIWDEFPRNWIWYFALLRCELCLTRFERIQQNNDGGRVGNRLVEGFGFVMLKLSQQLNLTSVSDFSLGRNIFD